MVSIWLLLTACESAPGEGPIVAPRASLARTSTGPAPDCSLVTSCGLGLDPARCIDTAEWFAPTMLEGVVVDANLSELAATATLAAGQWFTVFPGDPDPCAGLTYSFEVVP